MMLAVFRTLWAIFLLALTLPAAAQPLQRGPNNIAASLVAESADPAPGSTVDLAFAMTPKKGWHGYWENPGDAGLGMTLEWTLPKGVSVGPLRYPVPQTLIIAGLMNHVYEGPYAPLVALKLDPTLTPGTVLPISVRADWLACTDEICVPESATLTTRLTVGKNGIDKAARARFDAWRQRLPAPLGSEATFARDGKILRIAIPFPAAGAIDAPHFFARTDKALSYRAPQSFFRDGDRLIVETEVAGSDAAEIGGVLRIGENMGLDLVAKPGTVAPGGTRIESAAGNTTAEGDMLALLATALGGALLGGLLLNIMPCVFPILSLKAISLAKAGGDERAARRDALAYTAGIVLVCLALGGLLLALRAGGEQIGWAFQLQDPRIILALLLLVTAISFNLAGLFEFGTVSAGGSLTQKQGAAGSFWTGALAAFVATPCTAPFMAAAMGTALVLPWPAALLVFAGLGLGLALPFLAIGFVPALRRIMPRPGAWMSAFRRIMAVPMFLTALALVWLLGQQTGNSGVLFGLAAAMALALLLWWLGARQSAGKSGWIALAPSLAVAVAAIAALPIDAAPSASARTADATLPAQPFSEAKLAELRADGKPVFAYFTADWCITCKANEAAAIQREATAAAFRKAGVVVLEGDWTRRDAEISRYLEAQGRSGVPLYVWYAPGQEPVILPQVLTVDTLTALPG
ncbi:protein-disulfide reductase DsbD family protein [Sphingomonas ursincola]|uniref:Thiol:disulfide interchange protein n=2 Tax=Sphingomonas ursincola TaxID=56361 RepID=A0A7V8U8S7_9SPHN|nr:thioredoxin family protein [Sphingomonas ursincola]MBA1374334.1 thiol:disulfide interchange protein [Sphingomonas ursincola]